MTVSTGEASLVADLAARTGLDLTPVPDATRDAILAGLPTMGYIANPLDPWGAAEPPVAYGVAFRALAEPGAYDVLAIVHDFPYRSLPAEVATANEVTRELLAATAHRPDILPVYVSLTSGGPPPETKAVLDGEGAGAPLLRGAVEAFTAIPAVARWEGRVERRRVVGPWRAAWPALAADRTVYAFDAAEPFDAGAVAKSGSAGSAASARSAGPVDGVLPAAESLDFLAAAGFPTARHARVATAAEAVTAATAIGYPVAVKLDAIGLPHLTDSGGVRVGLAGPAAVRDAAAGLLRLEEPAGATIRGLLVQEVVPAGVELIVGLERDPQFGPTLLVGFGGVVVEVLDDVVLRLAPVTRDDAHAMLAGLRGSRLLGGYRGRSPDDDVDSVVDIIVTLGMLGLTAPEILEVDLNPVIVGPHGARIADALIVCRGGQLG